MIFGNWWANRKRRKQELKEKQALVRHFDTHEEFMKDNNGRRVGKHRNES